MSEYSVALCGNPNSGKTTIFNSLTGLNQYVGNWPGVTVEKKEGFFKCDENEIKVVDLPGIYSLSANSLDEKIAREHLLAGESNLVVDIVDGGVLERNLYLFTQLLEMDLNLILNINMIDEVEKKGLKINTKKLSNMLRVPVIETAASRNFGMEILKKNICKNLDRKKKPLEIYYGEILENSIKSLSEFLKGYNVKYLNAPTRWIAIKLFEKDMEIFSYISKNYPEINLEKKLLELSSKAEEYLGEELDVYIVERRYGFIEGIVKDCVYNKTDVDRKVTFSEKIDKFILNKYLGVPLFFIIMAIVFQLIFTIGNPVSDFINSTFSNFGEFVTKTFFKTHPIFSSFFKEGIIGGVGSVLVFLPNIFILFFLLTFLEQSGYMSRAAFIMDKFMHKLGLHGKSFIPMILGFGCNITGIMAARTLQSRKDRVLTIVINPLISCSARLTVYTLFAGVFFIHYQGLVVFSLYFIGIILAVLVARFFKSLFFKEEFAPLIMELPPYRLPNMKGVFLISYKRSALFVKKAGTVILSGVILIWILASLPPGVEYGSKGSIIGIMGSKLAPLFKWAGFPHWQIAVALIFGIIAKELVVGILGTLLTKGSAVSLPVALHSFFTPLSAYAFLLTVLLYVPCIATIAVIKKEIGLKWALFTVAYMMILGLTISTIVYQVGRLF